MIKSENQNAKMQEAVCATKSPLCWVGGKYKLAKKIIAFFPEHVSYIEPFGGAANVLLQKPPSKLETYNDINNLLVNFFRVLQDAEKFKELNSLLELPLYSRTLWNEAKENVYKTFDEVKKAYYFFILNRQSFAGLMAAWAVSKSGLRNYAKSTANCILRLGCIHERLKYVQIENSDYKDILKKFDNKNALFYLDPPYAFGERSNDNLYAFELSNKDHEELTTLLLNMQGKIILSGFDTPVYNPLEANGWHKIEIGHTNCSTVNCKTQKPKKKTEFIWCNFIPSGGLESL